MSEFCDVEVDVSVDPPVLMNEWCRSVKLTWIVRKEMERQLWMMIRL